MVDFAGVFCPRVLLRVAAARTGSLLRLETGVSFVAFFAEGDLDVVGLSADFGLLRIGAVAAGDFSIFFFVAVVGFI